VQITRGRASAASLGPVASFLGMHVLYAPMAKQKTGTVTERALRGIYSVLKDQRDVLVQIRDLLAEDDGDDDGEDGDEGEHRPPVLVPVKDKVDKKPTRTRRSRSG